MPLPKKDWVLTQERFDRLLAYLDADRETAGEKYEEIRQRLTSFFQWRGCSRPEEYADQTIDQVAKRINAGVELRVSNPYLYFHGVALNVLKEHWRAPDRELAPLDHLPRWQSPSVNPTEETEKAAEKQEKERRLDCLDQCLQNLPAGSLDLITRYYRGEKGLDKEYRKQLAAELQIPLNALRIRVHRVRQALEDCISDCLGRRRPGLK